MIILPKVFVPIEALIKPLFFLAGPVRGGGDWQRVCCELLERWCGACTIVIPQRYEVGHPLYDRQTWGREDGFDRQTPWERYYLEPASQFGCILFWLPAIDRTYVSDDPDFCYGRDTRGELGEWRGRSKILKELGQPRPKMVVGAERRFPGLSTIKQNFDLALSENYPIYPTLDETVQQAIEIARR